jgi:hypothetical protein
MATRLHIAAVGTTADPDASETLTALERFSTTVLDPAVTAAGGRFVGEGAVEVPEEAAADFEAQITAGAERSLSPHGMEVEISNGDGPTTRGRWTRTLAALPLGGIGFTAVAVLRPRSAEAEAAVIEEESQPPVEPVAPADESQLPEFLPDFDPDVLTDGLTVYATDPGHVEMVQTSVERMAAYGFQLPTDKITVVFDTTREACTGGTAFAAHGGEESYVVLCHDTLPTLVHEFTHIWAGQNMAETDQQAWLDERGLQAWSSSDAEWRDAGTEHLAEIVAWGLADDFKRVMVSDGHDVDGLNDSFQYVMENLSGVGPREAWYTMTEEDQLALVGTTEDPVEEDTTLLPVETVAYEDEELIGDELGEVEDLAEEDELEPGDDDSDVDLTLD